MGKVSQVKSDGERYGFKPLLETSKKRLDLNNFFWGDFYSSSIFFAFKFITKIKTILLTAYWQGIKDSRLTKMSFDNSPNATAIIHK